MHIHRRLANLVQLVQTFSELLYQVTFSKQVRLLFLLARCDFDTGGTLLDAQKQMAGVVQVLSRSSSA